MTLRMFNTLAVRFEQEWERRELLNGIVASTVANYSMAGDDRAPIEFMPSQQHKRKEYDAQRMRNKMRKAATQHQRR